MTSIATEEVNGMGVDGHKGILGTFFNLTMHDDIREALNLWMA